MTTSNPDPEEAPARSWGWKLLALVGLLTGVGILAFVVDVQALLRDARAWIDTLGAAGPVVFALLYALATVVAVPASVLTVAAGAMFGSVIGVAAVSLGSTLGAGLSFALARWIARGTISEWLAKKPRFAKLDESTTRHGALFVAITRLVPLFPFILLNYGFGLTKVPFWTFLGWSWLCMLPGTALYVVGGDALSSGLAEGRVPWGLVAAALVLAAIVALLVRFARRLLARRDETSASDENVPPNLKP